MVRRAKKGALSFGLFGLMGPFLYLLIGLLLGWDRWSPVQMIVEGWVTLLWPTRLVAIARPNDSSQVFLVLLVTGNVLLFALLGAAAGLLSRGPIAAGLLSGIVVVVALSSCRFLVGPLSSARTWAVVAPVLIATVTLMWRLQRRETAGSEGGR